MRAKITINIVYDEATVTSEKSLRRALEYAVSHLANNGLLSDEDSVVDEWSHVIEVDDA